MNVSIEVDQNYPKMKRLTFPNPEDQRIWDEVRSEMEQLQAERELEKGAEPEKKKKKRSRVASRFGQEVDQNEGCEEYPENLIDSTTEQFVSSRSSIPHILKKPKARAPNAPNGQNPSHVFNYHGQKENFVAPAAPAEMAPLHQYQYHQYESVPQHWQHQQHLIYPSEMEMAPTMNEYSEEWTFDAPSTSSSQNAQGSWAHNREKDQWIPEVEIHEQPEEFWAPVDYEMEYQHLEIPMEAEIVGGAPLDPRDISLADPAPEQVQYSEQHQFNHLEYPEETHYAMPMDDESAPLVPIHSQTLEFQSEQVQYPGYQQNHQEYPEEMSYDESSYNQNTVKRDQKRAKKSGQQSQQQQKNGGEGDQITSAQLMSILHKNAPIELLERELELVRVRKATKEIKRKVKNSMKRKRSDEPQDPATFYPFQ